METTPDKEKALALYKEANANLKKALEGIFGKSFFIGKITDRVTSMADVFRECGIKEGTQLVGDFHQLLVMDAVSIHKYAELILMTRTLNEGWVPKPGEKRFTIWFNISGSGLSLDDVDLTTSYTFVGSRLVFKTDALARHAAQHFLSDYSDYIIIQS